MSNVFGQVASNLTAAQKTASRTNLDLDNVTETRVAGIEGDITELSTANNDRTKTALNASGVAPIYACRAWVNFNGSGTVSINASGNVSSVTDNGTGDYSINFILSMQDENYAISGNGQYINTSNACLIGETTGTVRSVSLINIKTSDSTTGNVVDSPRVSVSVFR